MRYMLLLIVSSFLVGLLPGYSAELPLSAGIQQEVPPYAKWGRIAVQETKKNYPNAQIVDYLHIGRESTGDTSKEKFKLWLNEGEEEYGVYVTITFDRETEDIIDITLEKTYR
ncbi:YqzG/YhdC family protein [Virgibacillus xinjiangensis]|uniref:YqzG/YhdC family protein n=1 Tax=Virgibacillus xinjiangensis TaxID=393090 RepID=A0ABV7CX64_9BACI